MCAVSDSLPGTNGRGEQTFQSDGPRHRVLFSELFTPRFPDVVPFPLEGPADGRAPCHLPPFFCHVLKSASTVVLRLRFPIVLLPL